MATKSSAIAKTPKPFKVRTKKRETTGSRFTNLNYLIPRMVLSKSGLNRRKKHRRKDRKRSFKRLSSL